MFLRPIVITLALVAATSPTVAGLPQNAPKGWKRSAYSDGEGSYIGSDGVHHYASGVKCWNDYFIVSQNTEYSGMEQASSEIDCGSTSYCEVEKMSGSEKCQSTSIDVSAGIASEILSFGIGASEGSEKCTSAEDTHVCNWDDGKCHVVYVQPRYVVSYGYQRRRCDDGGDYTAWMQDFEDRSPTNNPKYDCDQPCSS